jgi:hypothetical protein
LKFKFARSFAKMPDFATWKQTKLLNAGTFTKRTADDPDPEPKRQRIAPKLAPTATLTKAFIPPVLLPQTESGESELEVEGSPKGKVLGRKGKEVTLNFVCTTGQTLLVRGEFLLIDTHFVYRMLLLRTMENGKIVMRLKRMLDPSMVPRPLTGWELKKTLMNKLKLPAAQAEAKALEILGPLITTKSKEASKKLKETQFMLTHLYHSFATEDWFRKLAEVWAPIKFRHFHILGQFWSQQILSQLSYNEIEFLAAELKEKPFYWLLKDYNNLRLPVIKPNDENLKKLKELLGIVFSQEEVRLIQFYNRICDIIEESACESLTRDQLSTIGVCGPKDPFNLISLACSSQYKLLVVRGEPGFNPIQRFYRRADSWAYGLIRDKLTHIMEQPTNTMSIKSTFSVIRPTAEQQAAVEAITREQNVILLTGDAGTGKTETCKKIFFSFPRGTVRAVAAYGEPALRQKQEYGDGMTIDSFLSKLERGTREGEKLAKTEVLIIDEIGIVVASKLARLLSQLRHLKKLVMLGDEKQLSPIGAGPVLRPFLKTWTGTRYLHRLTVQFRVDNDSRILIDNFKHYLRGEFSQIQYTNDLASSNPMKIIQRLTIPERLYFPKTPQETQERFTYYMQQILEIYGQIERQGKTFDGTRIFVQREIDATMMNEVMFRILNRNTDRQYNEHVFYPKERICFKQNMNFACADFSAQVACSRDIANNRIAVIKEIYDVNPKGNKEHALTNRIILNSTSAKKQNEGWYRVITFTDGTQINLTDYSLFWIKRAYATTIYSTIGSETDRVLIYIHPSFNFMHRGILYTAMTRAKREVIIVMDLNGDPTLVNSDLAKIWSVPSPEPENTLVNYIPGGSSAPNRNAMQLLDRPAQFDYADHRHDHIDDEEKESSTS